MGLFDALTDLVLMPVRVAVDVARLPVDLMNGDDLLTNTTDGVKKLEDDLRK